MSVERVLVILANPDNKESNLKLVTKMCKNFGEACQTKGLSVDLIDLYKDVENQDFNPLYYPGQKDTKVIEYQIRIKKADLVVFFYPIWWNSMPAVLKAFTEKVFIPGFAYQKQKGNLHGLLGDKNFLVMAFSKEPSWQNKFIFRNSLETFWTRGLLQTAGAKGKFKLFSKISKIDRNKEEKMKKKVEKTIEKMNTKNSVLDLF